MDTYGPGIDPYTKVIPPDMALTYASDDDRNSERGSGSHCEPEENDNNVLGEKELLGGTSIY